MPFIVRCCFFTCFVSLRSQVVIDGNCYFDISLPCLSLFLCTTFVFVASISMTSVSPPGISFIPESECKVNTFFRTGKTFRKIFCGIFTLPHATLRKSTPYDRIFFSELFSAAGKESPHQRNLAHYITKTPQLTNPRVRNMDELIARPYI